MASEPGWSPCLYQRERPQPGRRIDALGSLPGGAVSSLLARRELLPGRRLRPAQGVFAAPCRYLRRAFLFVSFLCRFFLCLLVFLVRVSMHVIRPLTGGHLYHGRVGVLWRFLGGMLPVGAVSNESCWQPQLPWWWPAASWREHRQRRRGRGDAAGHAALGTDGCISTGAQTARAPVRYTHITWDAGTEPFEIDPAYNAATGTATFSQEIYNSPSAGVWARTQRAAAGDWRV